MYLYVWGYPFATQGNTPLIARLFTCTSVFECRKKKPKPILAQISSQVVKLRPADLRLPARAWKVKLIGEGADDAGGVFDDTITEMCQELESGGSQLLIQTPNMLHDIGYNRDR